MGGIARHFARLGLVLLGTVLALLLLELGLQLAAVGAQLALPRDVASGLADARRVLALGDSNTYGLYVEREQSYPRVLERLWNADPERTPIEVINLGFPGTNSSTVRKNLPGLLRRVRPELVVVLVGVNDIWTVPDPGREAGAEPGVDLGYWLWRWSRLYRLYYMSTREFEIPELGGDYSLERPLGFEGRRVEVEQGGERFELGFEPAGREVQAWRRILSENLEAIVAGTLDYGAEIVLLSYPSSQPPYGLSNRVLRRFAATHDVRFVDMGAELAERCAGGECPELLRDQHPSPAGYERVARSLLRELDGSW